LLEYANEGKLGFIEGVLERCEWEVDKKVPFISKFFKEISTRLDLNSERNEGTSGRIYFSQNGYI
jgi:hypothetical protein